ncbi:MAG: acyl-CoA thioesterase [Chloroflexia bacterium]|nr:acyl-CoA thioesterase [Chloroflexia bacterium]
MHVRVRFHEVDALGHVNNAAYLNYLEQAAINHATTAGLDLERLRSLGGVFVARRHEVDFLEPAFGGDLLRVVTWLGAPRGARIERSSLILRENRASLPAALLRGDGETGPDLIQELLIVRAVTMWVFVNERGMPTRIPAAVRAAFDSLSARTGNDGKD